MVFRDTVCNRYVLRNNNLSWRAPFLYPKAARHPSQTPTIPFPLQVVSPLRKSIGFKSKNKNNRHINIKRKPKFQQSNRCEHPSFPFPDSFGYNLLQPTCTWLYLPVLKARQNKGKRLCISHASQGGNQSSSNRQPKHSPWTSLIGGSCTFLVWAVGWT